MAAKNSSKKISVKDLQPAQGGSVKGGRLKAIAVASPWLQLVVISFVAMAAMALLGAVIAKYLVLPENQEPFQEAMDNVRLARRRTGATRWGLFRSGEAQLEDALVDRVNRVRRAGGLRALKSLLRMGCRAPLVEPADDALMGLAPAEGP